jgi:hypothetical protein
MKDLARWERLEEFLVDHDTETFSVYDIAAGMGVTVETASDLIQSYLGAQRAVNPRTLYVLKREGRTRSATWSVGQRTTDARIISNVLFDDVQVKVHRAWKHDLDRLKEKNPQAARYVEAKLVAVVDGALQMLAVALDAEDGYETDHA